MEAVCDDVIRLQEACDQNITADCILYSDCVHDYDDYSHQFLAHSITE